VCSSDLLIRVTAYSIDSSEEIYYRKGLFWQNVGEAGFSAGGVAFTSLSVYNGVPYVAYRDGGNGDKANVMKYEGGLWQYVGGSGGFSAVGAVFTFLYVYNGVPYVAYSDESVSHRATVMKYEGGSWQTVGDAGFSAGGASDTSLYVYNGVPYVVYIEFGSHRATVMKYEGGSWQTVGSAGFSAGESSYTSLYVYNGVPYVAYRDAPSSYKATVMKYTGLAPTGWESVGSAGFSAGRADDTSLYVYNGIPYVVYQDIHEPDRSATVMKYTGEGSTGWESVGSAGFSAGYVSYTSLYVYNGVPYVAYQDVAEPDTSATVMKYDYLP